MEIEKESNLKIFLFYTLCYLFLGATFFLGIICILVIRESYMSVFALSFDNTFSAIQSAAFTDKVLFILLNICLMAFTIFFEKQYRSSIILRELFHRFLLVTSVQLFVLFLAHTLLVITLGVKGYGWGNYAYKLALGAASAEIVVGILLLFLRYWKTRRSGSIVNSGMVDKI